MMTVGLLVVGFGVFTGIMGCLMFINRKPYKFQLIATLALVLFALLMNVGAFFAYDQIVEPLIPSGKYGGSYGWFLGMHIGGLMLSVGAIGIIIGSAFGITRSGVLGQIVKTTPFPKTAVTAQEGRKSISKCPQCNTFLSLGWLVLSMYNTKHSCKNCGASLVWTKRRVIVSTIASVAGVLLVMLSKYSFGSYWPLVLFIPLVVILLILIPGQYRLEE